MFKHRAVIHGTSIMFDQIYLLTIMCHGISIIVTGYTQYVFLVNWCFKFGIQNFTNFAVSPRKGFGMVLECSGGNGTKILERPALRKGWEGHSEWLLAVLG